MATASYLRHDVGIIKTVYEGFSWTSFLFGLFVPLFRGDFKWFGISVLVLIVNSVLATVGIGYFTAVIWWFVFGFKYNEWHKQDLLLSGFKPA